MKAAAILILLCCLSPLAARNRVKTPKSQNAAGYQAHKAKKSRPAAKPRKHRVSQQNN